MHRLAGAVAKSQAEMAIVRSMFRKHSMTRTQRMRAAILAGSLMLPVVATRADEANPPAPLSDAERAVRMVPTKIAGTFKGGELVELRVHDRMAYVVKPTGPVDERRRWLWEFPFWLGINDGFGNSQHRNYVEAALAEGFHVAGIDVGPSCASPAAAKVCQEFYERLVGDYRLDKRARIMGQSHGGLIAYGWAFRNPSCVDRIAGI